MILVYNDLRRHFNLGGKPTTSFKILYYFQIDKGDEETDIYLPIM